MIKCHLIEQRRRERGGKETEEKRKDKQDVKGKDGGTGRRAEREDISSWGQTEEEED